MKQLTHFTLVIAQTLCVAILIMLVAGPTGCQEEEAQRAELVVQTGHADNAHFFAFSLDGKYLAISNQSNTKLWNIATGQELRTLAGGEAIFSPDGNTLATSAGTALKLWNWRTGQELRTLKSSLVATRMGAFSPKGDVLATFAYAGNTIELWDAKSGKQLRILAGHTSMIGAVVFSPDGKTLASDSANGPIKLWNWKRENR